MKNLIIKWLGLGGLIDEVVKIKTRDAIASIKDELVDYAIADLDRRYDFNGVTSKLDDLYYSNQDLETESYRWNDMADKVEHLDMEAIVEEVFNQVDFDKVKQLDDRLTELVAGYKLDVQLVKEEF